MKVDQNRIGGTVFESMHGTLVSSQTKCYGKISKVRAESKMKIVGSGYNRRRSMSTKKHNGRRNAKARWIKYGGLPIHIRSLYRLMGLRGTTCLVVSDT